MIVKNLKKIAINITCDGNKFDIKCIEPLNLKEIKDLIRPKIDDLNPLNGLFVNLSYPMPNGESFKLLYDDDIYLGNQVESEFNDGEIIRCFGILANMDFILISEYGVNGDNPELILYKKR